MDTVAVIKAWNPEPGRQEAIACKCRIRNEGAGDCSCGSVCQITKEIASRGIELGHWVYRPILRGDCHTCESCSEEYAAVEVVAKSGNHIAYYCAECYENEEDEGPTLEALRELIGWAG